MFSSFAYVVIIHGMNFECGPKQLFIHVLLCNLLSIILSDHHNNKRISRESKLICIIYFEKNYTYLCTIPYFINENVKITEVLSWRR